MSSSNSTLRYPQPLHCPRSPFSAAAQSLGLVRMPPPVVITALAPLTTMGIWRRLGLGWFLAFFGKYCEGMVEFLQSSVGIIHKNHAESITTFIKEREDEELKEGDVRPGQKKRITLCVEGNISVGKTTFLQRIANETLELRDIVEIVPEPIDKWQNVGPDHFNILDAFYAEPERCIYLPELCVCYESYAGEGVISWR